MKTFDLSAADYGVGRKSTADRMNRALTVWFSHPAWTQAKIAEEAGIDDRTFYCYKQNEAFINAYDEACREWFHDMQNLALQTMQDKCAKGDFQAAKYILDGNSYTSTQKLEVQGDTNIKITIDE